MSLSLHFQYPANIYLHKVSIYDFKALTTEQQTALAWDKGVFLMHRVENDTRYILYQEEGIYVEPSTMQR